MNVLINQIHLSYILLCLYFYFSNLFLLTSEIAPASNNRKTRNPVAKELATDLSKNTSSSSTNNDNNNQPPSNLQNSLRNLENLNTNSNNNSNSNNNHYSTPAPSKTPGELTFVFHNSTTDTDERVMHESDKDPRRPIDELPYIISINSTTKISERLKFPKALPFDPFISSSISYLNYGDLLECVADQEKSHWVMWLGKDNQGIGQVIHFTKRFKTIKVESLASACHDKCIRRINNHYNYPACDTEKIKAAVNSVMRQNANRFAQNFDSSECFVSWLRYQQDDFLNKKAHDQDFKVEFYLEK